MKTLLLTNKKKAKHLFAEFWEGDKKRIYLVDTGSDISVLFYRPLGSKLYEKKYITVMWSNLVQRLPGVIHDEMVFYYSKDQPEVIQELSKSYDVKISGIIGLDYMLQRKIVLDFSKLE